MTKQKTAPECDYLRKVSVRLLHLPERERFDGLLESHHYLHSARVGGQSLRYVAEVDGEWVALLVFSGAAPHTKARECEVRWTPRQRARRLCFVVNNSRFLVLRERQRYPNLASRVLALCLKRLSADWQEQWGHPVILVESYVDESQYRGTCYRACGFKAVGLTAGYGRSSRDYYEEHGQPKQLYLKELRPRALGLLRQGRLPADLAEHEEKTSGPCPFRATHLGSLLEVFEEFKDKRRGHGLRHRQPFVLACAAVAMLMGAGGYEAFEDECGKLTQRQLRALGCRKDSKTDRYRAPSDTTFFRVLNGLDAEDFDLRLGQWMMAQEISILQSLAIDGKCLRGSARTDGKPLYLLSAVSHRLRLTVAQQAIEQKSNEIPALEPLLRKLAKGALEGSLITADALHCQQKSSQFVTRELEADYLWGLKGNQDGILERAQLRLPQPFFSAEYDTGWCKEHGRLVRWRIQRVSVSPEEAALCGCWQFLAVWRERQELRAGKVTVQSEEYAFYATSAAPKQYTARQLLQAIRDHWGASENGSHYRRDVSLGEDACRIGRRTGAYVMASLRNLVLGLFELHRHRGKTRARTFPGWQRKLTTTQKVQLITRIL